MPSIFADDQLCQGKNCPRRNDCVRYLRTHFNRSTKVFTSTLCEWEDGDFLDYFIAVDQIDAGPVRDENEKSAFDSFAQ